MKWSELKSAVDKYLAEKNLPDAEIDWIELGIGGHPAGGDIEVILTSEGGLCIS